MLLYKKLLLMTFGTTLVISVTATPSSNVNQNTRLSWATFPLNFPQLTRISLRIRTPSKAFPGHDIVALRKVNKYGLVRGTTMSIHSKPLFYALIEFIKKWVQIKNIPIINMVLG